MSSHFPCCTAAYRKARNKQSIFNQSNKQSKPVTDIPSTPNSDALTLLTHTRSLFSSYLRIRSLASTPASSPELQQSRSELQSTLTDLAADLEDLIAAVRVVESDPYRFGLDVEEVAARRGFVNEVAGEIGEMRRVLEEVVGGSGGRAVTATKKGGRGGTEGGRDSLPNPADFDNVHDHEDDDGYGEAGDDDYAEYEQQQQVEMMHEQDEQLDGVFRTVGNLRAQASDMGRELEEQAVMLEEVDTLADRVGGKLENGMKKMGYIIRKNEGKLITTINNAA